MTNKEENWYLQLLQWIVDHALVFTTFGLGWKGLDLGFKYLKEIRLSKERERIAAQEKMVRQIVQDEINKGVSQKLDHLSDKIEMLGDAVLALKTKM